MSRLKLKHSVRKIPRKKSERLVVKDRPRQEAVFLPAQEHLVKMIAMQGADDDEIAEMLDVDPNLFQKWRKAYPSFAKALAEGRTAVDVAVTYKLFEATQGYEYEEETTAGKDGHVVKVKKFARPDVPAIKYWLENRNHNAWRTASTTRVTGKSDADPVGVKVETRNELIDAIVGMMVAKPDGTTKPAKIEADRIKR